jgi:hypothetical protein
MFAAVRQSKRITVVDCQSLLRGVGIAPLVSSVAIARLRRSRNSVQHRAQPLGKSCARSFLRRAGSLSFST